jgi:peptidoglycan/LPS O-acetylase OafA/YrhL
MTVGAPAPQTHIPGLDGVRGAAILLVIGYHALRHLPYSGPHELLVHRLVDTGWVGVDLFFVLSGFLITGILLDAKGGEGYFRRFYTRRVLRIVPLYVACIAFLIWVMPLVSVTAPDQSLARTQGWYWTYMVNVLIARRGWGAAVANSGHLWSLAFEEQFYIIWPALVFVLSRRALIRASAGLVIASSVLRAALVLGDTSWTAIYVLLPTRMDTLAIGALLAGLARDPAAWRRIQRGVVPGAFAATLVLGFLFVRESLVRSGRLTEIAGYPALAVLAGAAIVNATAAPAGSLSARIWTNAALRFFGRYSYGLYVWHHLIIPPLLQHAFPARALAPIGGSHLPGYVLFGGAALVASVGAARVSWVVIEEPFLRMKRLVPYEPQPRPSAIDPAREEPATFNLRVPGECTPSATRRYTERVWRQTSSFPPEW